MDGQRLDDGVAALRAEDQMRTFGRLLRYVGDGDLTPVAKGLEGQAIHENSNLDHAGDGIEPRLRSMGMENPFL